MAGRFLRALGYGAAVLLANCSQFAFGGSPIQFHDVTEQTGITFRHVDGSSGRYYLVEAVAAGLALFDYDNDGDSDIYFLNGAALPGTTLDVAPQNALFRNDGNWTFSDVTAESGTGDTGFGLGVAAADYDNDGDQDLYLNNFGPNVLYRNNGDGSFTDVTGASGVANGDKVGGGVAFLDADRDGDLDLYVANYIKIALDRTVPKQVAGFPMYRGPHDFDPEPDVYYRNNGDGTFTDLSRASGIAAHAAAGMGLVAADYDDDGDADIFVCNDETANFLFQNDGMGKFTEVALSAGVAYDLYGGETGSMGVDCADFDNDGRLDFFMTDYAEELPILYRNTGGGLLEDVTLLTGAGAGSYLHANWGTGFVDFDNDGDRDIFIANGHLNDNIEKIYDRQTYQAKNFVLVNNGDGKFVNQTDSSGDGMALKFCSRGTGFDDLDNDGDVDAVVLNLRGPPTILRNDSPNTHHWIQVQLKGKASNRDGVGARVKVVAGDLTQIDEVHSGRGYQSHHGTRLHFGLGDSEQVNRVEVRWPDGHLQVFRDPAVDQLLRLDESDR